MPTCPCWAWEQTRASNLSITGSSEILIGPLQRNRTWFQKLAKASTMSPCLSLLISWMLRKTTQFVNKSLIRWCSKSRRRKSSSWRLGSRQEMCLYQLRKTNTPRCSESRKWSDRTPKRCRLLKLRLLRHLSTFMKETSRLWKKSSSKLNCLLVLTTSLLSGRRRFLGEYWFHCTRQWWMTKKMRGPRESKSNRLLQCLFPSCHREWKHMRKRWKRRQRRREATARILTFHLDRLCPRKCLTLKDCTRNLLPNLKETRVLKDWLFQRLSISTSPSKILP